MKKFKIEVCEKIELNHTYEIELPNDIYEDGVWDNIDMLDHGKDDIKIIIENFGGSIIKFIEDGSGEVELEVTDVEEV
ncbi:hypothetical protein [Terrisporobacter glycolicus]|uniref:Uncharacterized protein n=1 Tax=Terrisporobacter glycolicus ATCC 14880 = DSM 1288 TaxID=1121315 RepID=A0ABZ2EWU3_9FIRM|nr:hypothetical protein [Terrisporobacter glycolicus]